MNNLPARADGSPEYAFVSQKTSYPTETKIITTIALLVLGYYALSLLDAWPPTIKRSLNEFIVYLIPSPLIYAMQYIMVRLGRLGLEDVKFTRANFGDMKEKQEAIRKVFGQPQLPLALGKVGSLPGVRGYMSLRNETGPPGLGNWDNSCYQNSVLQGLASLPAFLDYTAQSLRLCEKTRVPASTHQALVTLLEQLADTNNRKTVLWTPGVLKSMDSWQQQDAQEYFSRVLDALEKESTAYTRAVKHSAHVGLEWLRTVKDDSTRKWIQTSGNFRAACGDGRMSTNPVPHEERNPIDGLIAQGLECKTCGFTEGLSLTQFNCLTLNLGLRGPATVEDLLNEYTMPEEVEGVECENCTKVAHGEAGHDDKETPLSEEAESQPEKRKKPVLRTKAKQITIGRLPKDLVLHINRSIFDRYGNQLKNTAPVRVLPTLNFRSRWCAPLDESEDSVEAAYELKCVVTHYGRHDDGHYVALGKRGKDWYSFNDEVVNHISEEDVLARINGFMLFYEAVSVSNCGSEAGVFGTETRQTPSKNAPDDLIPHPEPQKEETPKPPQPIEIITPETECDIEAPAINFNNSTSASNQSSPVDEPAKEHCGQNGLPFPAMRTASEVHSPIKEQQSTGTSVVPVI